MSSAILIGESKNFDALASCKHKLVDEDSSRTKRSLLHFRIGMLGPSS